MTGLLRLLCPPGQVGRDGGLDIYDFIVAELLVDFLVVEQQYLEW